MFTIGPWPYNFWVSLGICSPGAFAFDAEHVAAMQDLLYGVRWLPGQLLRLAPGMALPLAHGGDRRVPLVFVPGRRCHAGRLW